MVMCFKDIYIRIGTFFTAWLLIMTTSSAQSTSFVMARNMGEINGKISVDIKWFTKDIKPGSSVFIYRQENQTGKWIRINDLPILPKKPCLNKRKLKMKS